FVDVNTILVGYFPTPVTEQRKGDPDLVGKGFIGEGAIHTYTQNLGVGGFQLFQILLEGLHLRGSATGEGKNIERHHDVALISILAQRNIFQVFPIEVLQLEIGSHVPDFQVHGRRRGLVCLSLVVLSSHSRTQQRRHQQAHPQHYRNTPSFHRDLQVNFSSVPCVVHSVKASHTCVIPLSKRFCGPTGLRTITLYRRSGTLIGSDEPSHLERHFAGGLQEPART